MSKLVTTWFRHCRYSLFTSCVYCGMDCGNWVTSCSRHCGSSSMGVPCIEILTIEHLWGNHQLPSKVFFLNVLFKLTPTYDIIANMDRRMTELSTSDDLSNVSWVQKAALQLYRRNVPLLHTSTQRPGMSLHMISFTKPSPALVLQATNAGVRRPG